MGVILNIRLAGIEKHSLVNGPGVRYVVFTQGCLHHCPGCHNPETWDSKKGEDYPIEFLLKDILSNRYLDGVTFSGGDPLIQSKALLPICQELKKQGLNIWCYTGYLYEDILQGKASQDAIDLLPFIDVLVDGPFILALLSKDCLYRGSANQRLIDVQKSLKENKVVLVDTSKLDYGL